jgi:hypothetical protein
MSHENSMQINQDELASEYVRYVESKSSKGIMSFFVKALVIIVLALVIVTGGAFAMANFSPTTYAQAKDIIFENIDVEKITGLTDSTSKEYLDSWLILKSQPQQSEEAMLDQKAQGEIAQEEQPESQLN